MKSRVNKEFILKRLSQFKYITINDICQDYNINYYAISTFIDGDKSISVGTVLLFAHALNVDISDFFS